MIRLRQIALVAADLEGTTAVLCEYFGLSVCFRDPGVGEFGLTNTLMLIGDQFLEVVSPTVDGTTAGRLLDKRHTDVSGYMVIYEVDDLDEREADLGAQDVRVVWRGDLPDIRGRHLHPGDVGGAIVSIDQPTPPGAWRWGGPTWQAHAHNAVVTSIAGAWIGADDPEVMRARWRALGLDQSVGFQVAGPHGQGLDVVELVAADRSRVGESLQLGAVTMRLV
jgi:hypothetical protein